MALLSRNNSKMLRDDALGIKIFKEERLLRVILGEHSILFADADAEQFLHDYRQSLAAILLNFEPAIINDHKIEFTPTELKELTQEITLLWMRFYISTRQPVRITQSDLAHPQTWAIVLKKAEEKYGARSDTAIGLAAHTVGVGVSEFARWMRVEEDRVNNM